MTLLTSAKKIIHFVATAMLVVACGGGGSSQIAGIDRLGITTGAVTGFGSIFVNGIEYETDNADFTIDDDSVGSSQANLAVGDVVVITFDTSASNVALAVVADEAVEGPIDSIALSAGVFVVAGQTVNVDAATSFDDSISGGLAGLAIDDFVEVSGFIDGDGVIRATRIEPSTGQTEVHGMVSALNTAARTFMINALLIDYGTVPAIIDDDFPGGVFANGDQVEVKGTNFSGATLLATKVEPDGFGAGGNANFDDFAEAEIEGFITRFASATDFDVSGLPVSTNASTIFEGGVAADLGLNVKVEVEGDVNNSGVLVADKVDIRRSNDLRVTAQVDSVNAGNNTLTLLGIEIRVDALTRFEDKSDAELEPFNLSLINTGDYVEVRGGTDTGSADILALLVEREDQPDIAGEETSLQAFVEAINQPLITIAGVAVDTTGAQFRNANDQPVSAAAFFAALQVGDLVEAEGDETGATSMSADEVELED